MNLKFARRGIALVASAVCLAVVCGSPALAAKRSKPKRAITKPSFDPAAEKVELFAGIEAGVVEAKIIPKDSLQGNVFFENKTDKPLTVEMPDAFVGVHVLPQVGGYGGLGGGAGGLGGGMGGGGMGGGGGGQMMGGGMGGGMMGGMGGGMGGMGGGMGGGFFSIPPESVVRLPYKSVCLEHGKPDPTPRSTYRIVKLEEAVEDPALQELVRLVANNRIHPQVAQAAAWHLTDDMSWRELAAKRIERLGGLPSEPYFSTVALFGAQQLVAQAVEASRDDKDEKKDEAIPSRTRTVRPTRLVR